MVTGVVEIGYCWALARIVPTGEETSPADDGGLEQTLWNAYPEWWDNLFVLAFPSQMLGQIAVIPLLTAPSSQRYFHPPVPDDRLPYPPVALVAALNRRHRH